MFNFKGSNPLFGKSLGQIRKLINQMKDNPRKVRKFLRSCYGLPDSGANWAEAFATWMRIDLGFKRCLIEGSVFIKQWQDGRKIVVGAFVDDAVWNGDARPKQWSKRKVLEKYKAKLEQKHYEVVIL